MRNYLKGDLLKTVGAKVSILTRYVKLLETYMLNIVTCGKYMHIIRIITLSLIRINLTYVVKRQ